MSDGSAAKPEASDRLQIAIRILTWSTVGLLIVAAVMVLGSLGVAIVQNKPEVFLATTERIFTALLPLLGTWVGTVLAFYFSKDNFEAASASVRENFREFRSEGLETIRVGEAMRPYEQITSLELDDALGDKAEEISLKDSVRSKFTQMVTRVPVFSKQKKTVRYMIHRSLIDNFLNEYQPQADKDKVTLKEFLEYDSGRFGAVAKESFAFVKKGDTLAAAVRAMKERAEQSKQTCQDVFVTETGNKNEPVLGWLSDRRIQNRAKIS